MFRNERHDKQLQNAELVVRWMDAKYLDPILGFLLPGLGDGVGLAIGVYLVVVARRLGAAPSLQARMLLNLGVDALLGAIPLVGDIFDFAFRANQRNLALLKNRSDVSRVHASDRLMLAGAVLFLCVAITAPIFVFFRVIGALLN